MNKQVIRDCITWNRERMERSLRDRNSSNKEISIGACQNAQRYANNISALEAQLGEQS